jgi:hypothetical protein
MKPVTVEHSILKPSQRKVSTHLKSRDAIITITFLEASMKKHWPSTGK